MQDLSSRKEIVILIFITVGIIFLIRLFYIQVIDDSYKLSAENNVLRYVTEYPSRGLIYDRKGKVMVYNQPAYDLMVIPKHVEPLDTIDLCNLIDITKEEFIEKLLKAKKYSYYKPSIFQEQLNSETYAALQEKMYKFDGFLVYNRSLRKYPYNAAASLLGYINEVSGNIIEKDSYYSSGDYIGASGIEKSYEKELRGRKGVKVFMVDVFNRVKSSFRDGTYDTLPEPGTNLKSTIDIELQQLGEKLMQNKKGSLVAIEPSTGEILAMVTSPTYDPNLLVGRVRSENYLKLHKDTLVPLFNRALMAQYPPGSIFKLVQALIAMQEKAITPQTMFTCNKRLINCHNHPFPLDVFGSIQHSCNPYYYMVFKRILNQGKSSNVFIDTEIGFAKWREHVGNFGLGQRLGVDVLSEKGGNIPTIEYYDKIYGRRHWKFETVYSLGIGQGEILVVPLQMANLACIFANRGYYITPHVIKRNNGQEEIHYSKIEEKYFNLVADAMEEVVNRGTARRAKIDSITVCGKTGTAENPHGEDHSVFIAFAPKYNPKIAVSVYVENSGFGGTWAAPIASLIIEKYLTRELTDQKKLDRILEADFIHSAIEPN
ncbi:MAG TPA: penicillin-binding protein 2 [Flavobacteriales bacterium]|nr:penicillin-binding protein 2 [Flavobacteriales bacterium]HIO72262.1 penicillin-binding protein 2 [Flavobacteriales bacterium]